jgi:hypothetical protein
MTNHVEAPVWGNLRRTRPFSDDYGFDRGTPIDRYYVNQFLGASQKYITGDVLEIQQTGYTKLFGHDVRRSDSVDVDASHGTTFVCDLARSEDVLASDSYDCFLMPNTLNHLQDLESCMRQALRVIRPGGSILATVATFVPLTPDFKEFWRLTPAGWNEVVRCAWPNCDVSLTTYGNVLSAAAAMMGLAHEELTPAELDVCDPRYPVLIALGCRKPQ